MDNLPPSLLIVNAAQVVTPVKEWNLKVIPARSLHHGSSIPNLSQTTIIFDA
ncbi:MAG: hypothetical protein ABFD64_14100 [Armatimonadota bacterium]